MSYYHTVYLLYILRNPLLIGHILFSAVEVEQKRSRVSKGVSKRSVKDIVLDNQQTTKQPRHCSQIHVIVKP